MTFCSQNDKIRKITGIAVFICLVVVLQLFSNYVTFGPVSITLALIPIVVGSIIYGPLAGFILGAVCGVIIFFGPGTITLFWPYGIVKTFILCVLKTGLAGLVSGLIYKLLSNKNNKLSCMKKFIFLITICFTMVSCNNQFVLVNEKNVTTYITIYGDALTENEIQQLPLKDQSKEYIAKMINQIGDYAKYLNNKLVDGEQLTAKDRENLENLYYANLDFKNALQKVMNNMGSNYSFSVSSSLNDIVFN